jgi:thiol-disulfide isomerase/thioredoxin
MINFWAVGCGACVAEMPDIDEVYKTWSGSKELEILAINAGDYEMYIKNKVEEEKWTLPIFVDSDRTAVAKYQISRIPRTFFIDTNGIIRKIEMGRFDNYDQIKEALNSLQ